MLTAFAVYGIECSVVLSHCYELPLESNVFKSLGDLVKIIASTGKIVDHKQISMRVVFRGGWWPRKRRFLLCRYN